MQMLLWDYEMRELRPLVDDLPPRQCFALSLRAIRHVLTYDETVMAEIDLAIADFVRRSLDLADEAAAAGRATIGSPAGYRTEVRALLADYSDDNPAYPEDGADSLVMALLELYGETDAAPANTYEVLSFTYQVVLIRLRIDVVTPEIEREHATLVQLIAEQKDLVRAAA
ncbi:hypothetical protein JNUCC0626_08545 [Lentzea sp. JNUCC 0626]|uniref:hypothetical protein n=1 Tax=Lentzea sp. JNUCC 0626 TaxID=3367513 RepID=UPI003747A525